MYILHCYLIPVFQIHNYIRECFSEETESNWLYEKENAHLPDRDMILSPEERERIANKEGDSESDEENDDFKGMYMTARQKLARDLDENEGLER